MVSDCAFRVRQPARNLLVGGLLCRRAGSMLTPPNTVQPAAPDRKDEENVEPLGVVPPVPGVARGLTGGVVLVEHFSDKGYVDLDTRLAEAREGVGGFEVVVEELAQPSEVRSEPFPERDGETLLGAIHNLPREMAAGDGAEQAFPLSPREDRSCLFPAELGG